MVEMREFARRMPAKGGRVLGLLAIGLTLTTAVALEDAAAETWPSRPITMIVPWGAGGGTDVLARTLAAAMEKNLGQPVNVVNRTGGSGLIGHSALAGAAPDGYTIGTINVDLSQLVCKGLTDLTADKFTHIALLNAEAAGVSVNAESEWTSLQQVLDAIKDKPAGTYKASGTGTGGIYHLSWAGLLVKAGIDPNKVPWVPSQGEAPSLKDVAAGAVDFVAPPLTSALPLIEAGKVRPLATMSETRFSKLPDVPTVKEAVGIDWTSKTWRMIGAPAGMDAALRDQIVKAVRDAYDGEAFTAFMNERGFAKTWMGPVEAAAYHKAEDSAICDVMKAAGLQ